MITNNTSLNKAIPFLTLLRNMDLRIPVKNLKSGLDLDLFKISSDYLGIPFTKLQDKEYLRFFMTEKFHPKVLAYLCDDLGSMCMTLEHGVLFSHRARLEGYDNRLVQGVLFAISAHAVSEDISQLKASTSKGVFKTKFLIDINNLQLKGVKNFQRSYMKRMLVDSNENAYYFEKPLLASMAYLMSKGYSFDKSKSFVNNTKTGLFYSWLPLSVEDRLLPYIVSGKFDTSLMDGYFASTLISDIIYLEENNLDGINYYNRFCKPYMLEIMGIVVKDIKDELVKNGVMNDILYPYYASERCLAVKVLKGYSINTLLPQMGKYFKKVDDLSILELSEGFWV